MQAKRINKGKTQNRSSNISMAPLTPDQALAAALRVKMSDVQKLERQERAGKKSRKKRD